MSVPNIKILSQVVSEESLTEKKFTDKQTNIVTEKTKTIYPLYTSYAGGLIIAKIRTKSVSHYDISSAQHDRACHPCSRFAVVFSNNEFDWPENGHE